MNYHIEILKNSNTVYMRNTGPYGSAENFKMMSDFKHWIIKQNLHKEIETFGIFGIALDDPNITPQKDCRYDVLLCTSSTTLFKSDDIRIGTFEGGKYAVFTIVHTVEEVQKFWNQINIEVTTNNLILRNKPIIERFKDEEGTTKYCEFLIPIL